MKITLYNDSTLDLNLNCIIDNLNKLVPNLRFFKGGSKFNLKDDIISSPKSYDQISKRIKKESADSDEVLFFTEKPYDNNYFFDPHGNEAIISLYGWDHLTIISRNNGAIYFICAIIIRLFGVGRSHKESNTGCINDFWRDKTGIDVGMKTAFICPECIDDFNRHDSKGRQKILKQTEAALDDLCIASRAGIDICDYWDMNKQDQTFDVFLCHNSEDKNAVRKLNTNLKQKTIKTWFDEEQLPPGRLWQELLEKQIGQIKTAAVIVGKSGIGPWQHMEIRAFLQEFVRRSCPVIPVILSDCGKVPPLPLFLSQLTWVDFRKTKPAPFQMLLWGITGEKPL